LFFIFIPVSGYIISLIGKQKKQSTKAQEEQGIFIYHRRNTYGLKLLKVIIQESYFNTIFKESTQRFFQTI
jgi:subfamily B ATP-binding cassette protein MsbA